MKKIAIYVDSMNAPGGRERVIANLINQWIKYYKIVLIVKDDGKSFYNLPKDLEIVSIKNPLILDLTNRKSRVISIIKNFFTCQSKLKKVFLNNEFDYIYVGTPFNSYEIYKLGKKYTRKMIIGEHASIDAFNRIYKLLKKIVYPKAYCISVPNKTDVAEYKKWNCNAVYVPHLVTFKNNDINKLDSKIILNVGRLTADKRQSDLLKIWSNIEHKNNWKLWIIGDGEEKDKLEKMIDELNLSNSVKLMNATNNISEIYKKATIFAFSSVAEGFGMVLLEAMSFGIPCISFDCPSGPRDVIISNYNGYLIENNNFEAFKDKLEYMINMDNEQLEILGKNAFNTVEKWDNEKIIQQWKEIYR